MRITALKEGGNETRVAITPNVIKHYLKLGLEIAGEHDLGKAAGFSDNNYQQLEALIDDRKTVLKNTSILVSVNEPSLADVKRLPPQSLIIGSIENDPKSELITYCSKEKLSLFSMNLIPRISRAQSMDSLSSQANLAGYRAVLEAVSHFNRAIPMMMTAAGMIQPAKILILGAGVAGLQAIATAKRLGAIVYAFDVRVAAQEQVESLGAEFIKVDSDEDAETSSGYAGEVSEEYKRRQAELIDNYAKLADIVITTALIPGKPAPLLLSKKTVDGMKAGSVIVDLATSRGGNCELSQADKVIKHGEVTLVGYSNLARLVPATASELYANNSLHLIRHLIPSGDAFVFNEEDDIIKQGLLCHEGSYLPFQAHKEKLND